MLFQDCYSRCCNSTHLWEYKFDRSLKTFGDGDHDICPEYPENVIEEESAQEDAASHHVIEVEQLHSVNSEGHAEEVVGQPVLLYDVPHPDCGAQTQAHQVMGAELIVQHCLFAVSLPLNKFSNLISFAALVYLKLIVFTCVNLR